MHMHRHVAAVVFFALTFVVNPLAWAGAMDSFRYVHGEVFWAHTKAPFESEGSKDFTGLGADVAYAFNDIYFARAEIEYNFRGTNNNQSFYSLGGGGIVNLYAPLNAYAQIGLFGFSRNREVQADIDAQGSSTVRHLDDLSYSLEFGLIADLYPGKLNVGYHFAGVTGNRKDFIVGVTYPWHNSYSISLEYRNRNWKIQDGHVFGLGIKYMY